LTKDESNQSYRAADELFLEFERMIISGELVNGETLPPEREIVEAFGVSRTVVREAILALSNKGLVETKQRFRQVLPKPGTLSVGCWNKGMVLKTSLILGLWLRSTLPAKLQ